MACVVVRMQRLCRLFLFLAVGMSVVAQEPPAVSGSRSLPPLPEGAFTLIVIPDTQSYRGRGCKATPDSTEPVSNPNLAAQVDWILANRQAQNVVFVTHVGDIVDRNTPEQWAVARQHLDRLRGVLPLALTVGNHDMTSRGDARLFQQHFPAAGFAGEAWYLESYEHGRADRQVSRDNVNSAQVFRAGGVDFLHLSLECNAPDDVLAWAGGLLARHASRRALITTHMDLGIVEKPETTEGYIHDPKGRMNWIKIHGARGNTGRQMWDKLYRRHANLDFVLCGDQSRVTALRRADPADDGHLVHALLSDYMSLPVLRLMRFVPGENRVDVLTLEVTKERLVQSSRHVPDAAAHLFSLPFGPRP